MPNREETKKIRNIAGLLVVIVISFIVLCGVKVYITM